MVTSESPPLNHHEMLTAVTGMASPPLMIKTFSCGLFGDTNPTVHVPAVKINVVMLIITLIRIRIGHSMKPSNMDIVLQQQQQQQ